MSERMNESLTQLETRHRKQSTERLSDLSGAAEHVRGGARTHRKCGNSQFGRLLTIPPSFCLELRDDTPPRHGLLCHLWRSWSPRPPSHLSSWKQWAAVITQRSAMRAPPQMCRPRTWRLACHGHSPSEDTAPPTMRPEGPWRPQSGGGEEGRGGRRWRGRRRAVRRRGIAGEQREGVEGRSEGQEEGERQAGSRQGGKGRVERQMDGR